MRDKGGKAFKRTTSRGRKIKRRRGHVRWPVVDLADLERELVGPPPRSSLDKERATP